MAAGVAGVVVVDTVGDHVPRRREAAPGAPGGGGAPRAARRTHVAYLSNLAVAPGARRGGVGTRLLRAAEAEARSWGCRAMALHVDPGNAAAVALYAAAGYRSVGRQPGWQAFLEGRQAPLSLMMRPLTGLPRPAAAAKPAAAEQ